MRNKSMAAAFVISVVGCHSEPSETTTPKADPATTTPTPSATVIANPPPTVDTAATNTPPTYPSINANPPPTPTGKPTAVATGTGKVIMNPPMPPPDPEPNVSIIEQSPGKCIRVVNVKCPPGVMCNPPPPVPVPCPDAGVGGKPAKK